MRRFGFALAGLFLGTLLTAAIGYAAAGADDWPGWLGPNRDGKSPDRGLMKEWPDGGPPLLWKAEGIGKGFSGAAVSGGLVYITGDVDGKLVLFAFDQKGQLQWKTDVDAAWTKSHPGARSTPTIDDGLLYLLSGNGVIVCMDAKSGQRKWTRNTKEFGGAPGHWGYAESILIYKDLAILKPGGSKCIAALNKKTGATVWTSSGFDAGPEYGSCLLVEFEGKPIVITGTKKGLFCVAADDGKLQWSNDFASGNTANCPTPAYSNGYVFWAVGYGKGGVCVKLKREGDSVSADEVWTTRDMVCHHGGYIIDNGYIYGNNSNGWACLKLETGEKMWGERAVGKGSLCYADGMLYLFGEKDGRAALAACSPEGLDIRGQMQVDGSGPSWAHPVVIGGRLYLRYDANLYCFRVAKAALAVRGGF